MGKKVATRGKGIVVTTLWRVTGLEVVVRRFISDV